MPATTSTIVTFDGQEEKNLAKFEIEHETQMHSIHSLGGAERIESLPGETHVTMHIWVNGVSTLLDTLHTAQGMQLGFQTVITVSYSDGGRSVASYDDCAIIAKTVKGEANKPTWTYYKITCTRERISG